MEILKQQKYLMKKIEKYTDKIHMLMGLLDIVSQIVEQEEYYDDDTTESDSTDDDCSLKTDDIQLLSDDESESE